jgi:sugar phosphate isomerase/epimerase
MKKSISIWSFPATLSLTEKLRLAREAGFDGFEIDLKRRRAAHAGQFTERDYGSAHASRAKRRAVQRPCHRSLLGRESGKRRSCRPLSR